MNVLGSALPAVHGSAVAASDDEFDDYWMCSPAAGCNLGTYDAAGQRVVQVINTSASSPHYTRCTEICDTLV